MVALECIQNKRLVCLRDLCVCESPLVRKVHLCRHGTRVEPGKLGVHLEIDGFGRLDTDDELVTGDVFKDPLHDIFELDANLDL